MLVEFLGDGVCLKANLAREESAKAHFDVLNEVLTKAGSLPVKLFRTEAERLRRGGKRLDKETTAAITQAFWENVDRRIDLLEEDALKRIRTTV